MSRVFVLGNASLDTTLRVPRLPAPGETLMATGIQRSPGGKGLNQAVVAARAGAAVHFLAPLGDEPETALIRAVLAEEPLAACDLPEVGVPTDLSTLLVAPDGENCIVSTGACADALPEAVACAFVAALRDGDVLLMQGNLPLAVTRAAATMARDRGATVLVNSAPLRWDYDTLLPLCDIIVANRFEAEAIAGGADPCAAIRRLAAASAVAIVTLGADGCLLAEPDLRRLPAVPVHAVDTSGAGDTFCGALAAAIARGWAGERAIAFAQRAAAITVGRPGCFPSFPTVAELAACASAA